MKVDGVENSHALLQVIFRDGAREGAEGNSWQRGHPGMLETVRINKMLSEGLTLQHSVSSYSLSFLHSANISFKYLKDDFFPQEDSL